MPAAEAKHCHAANGSPILQPMGGAVIAFFPLFLLGAMFGKLMEASGAALAIAPGGLDALPHNGAVITLLGICKLTHRQSFLDIFMVAVAVAVPLLALGCVVLLGSRFGSF
ncbi:hypothetical protein IP87_09390 [beta proteobacterium AAP121]|nr:hypothetical protein IP80_09255 [beta proteobacterium AAP65]KPF97961.1 hypothetical protein IP87_09390 [beta proteobacterium AAP121]